MENQYKQADEEIDIADIIRMMVGQIPMMIAVGIFTALAAFLISRFFLVPTYESTTKIYILNKQENSNITYSDLQMGMQLTKDYTEMVLSRTVLEEVIEHLGLEISYETLKNKVFIYSPESTRIIAITVRDAQPVQAMKIANAIREAAVVHITDVMDIEAINVVETADVPMGKTGPNVKKFAVFGGFAGAIIVAAIALVLYLTNDTIKTGEDVEKYLELSILGLIPLSESEKKNRKKAKKK